MKKGAEVQYSDPFIPKMLKTRKFNFHLESIDITKENIKSFDLILLTTDHDSNNYELIKKHAKLIIDTRGRFEKQNNIISA